MNDIGFGKEYENPRAMFRWLIVNQIRFTLRGLLIAPFYFRLEVGKQRMSDKLPRLHVHILAERDAGLITISRKGQVIKPIDDFIGIMEYLSKPNLAYSEQLEIILKEEKLRLKKLGQTRFPSSSGYVFNEF